MGDREAQYAADKAFMENLLSRAPFNEYDAYWCLCSSKHHGVGVLVKRGIKPPISISRTLTIGQTTSDDIDTTEGRVLILEYERFVFMNSYVPNNGAKPDRWERRRLWDARMEAFVKHHNAPGRKPLIWCGDLNVAHRDVDVGPRPEMFVHTAGFTVPERQRFGQILLKGGLVDVYRALHGDRQAFTWRSQLGSGGPIRAAYDWAGMRLDYFIASASLMPRVKSVRLSTDSMVEEFARLRPVTCFFGSDHCALFLTLHPHDASDAKEHAKEHAKDVICISD
jgi:exodeoxyribonuclease III